MGRLDGKVALITGSAVGMGAAHAERFVEEGAQVVVSDVNEGDGAATADALGDRAMFAAHDVTSPESWKEVVDRARSAFGPVTVLVNNAGLAGPIAQAGDISIDDYHSTIDVDQHGVHHGMQAVIPGMLEAGGGSIVNISSIAGIAYVVGTTNVAYAAAKFAVRGLTRAAAVDYAQRGVRVNSIHPGGVLTPMMEATLTDDLIAGLADHIPMGRLADTREISNAVLFLASDESSYITGTELVVDGGWLAR